jgi:AraC family transcriptional regulator, transcriptional activator of pobA
MENIDSFLKRFKQNEKLPIRLVSPDFGHLPPELVGQFGTTHRTPHYFFLFMIEGCTQHGVDLEQF